MARSGYLFKCQARNPGNLLTCFRCQVHNPGKLLNFGRPGGEVGRTCHSALTAAGNLWKLFPSHSLDPVDLGVLPAQSVDQGTVIGFRAGDLLDEGGGPEALAVRMDFLP